MHNSPPPFPSVLWCLCSLLIVSSLHAQVKWEPLPKMKIGVFNAAATRSGRWVIVTGGLNPIGVAESAVQVLDLDASRWLNLGHLGAARCFHAQVTLPDGRVLVLGGQTGRVPDSLSPLDTCEIVSVADNGAIRTQPIAPLPARLHEPTAHVLPDGRVIAIGGASAFVLDTPTEVWRRIELRRPRRGHASILLPDGDVLVVGGINERSIERIHVAQGLSQTLAAELPEALDDHALTLLVDGRVWVLGGQGHGGVTTDRTWLIDLSDPGQARIEPGPALGIAGGVADHALVDVGPWTITAGGEAQDARGRDVELATSRLLDRRTLEVWSLPNLPNPHDDAAAVATERGMVLLGGYRARPTQTMPLPIPRAVREVLRLELPERAMTDTR